MDLFEVINEKAFPSVHALLIEPFKTMWENDISPGKGDSVKAFTYIELLCSPKKSNPFLGYSEEDRPKKVRLNVWGDENYRPDNVLEILNAVTAYKELLRIASPSYNLFESSLRASQELTDFLNTVDLTERNFKSGMPIYKPADVSKALKEVPDLIKAQQLMRDRVHSEIVEEAKTRKQREIGFFER